MTDREMIEDLRAALAESRQAAARLTHWKTEAIPVLDGLQEIGKALGLPPGARITGPQALAAVEALVAERDRLREALGRVEALAKAQATRAALTQPATDEEAGQ